MTEDARVVIGQITGPHGVRGELKLRPLTDYPERFLTMESLSLYRDKQSVGTYKLLGVRTAPSRGSYLVTLDGVVSMDQAEVLRGCTVEILPHERVPLEEGEYWSSDLIGCDAFDENGSRLGTVKDVTEGGSRLLLIVDDDGKTHAIPAVPEYLLDADPPARRVTLRLIEGLWEL